MANVNLALDDIITTEKKRGRGAGKLGGGRRSAGGGGGRRVGGGRLGINKRNSGGFRNEKYFSDDVPSGKWKHDKFLEAYGSGNKNKINGGSSIGVGAKRSRGGGNQIVKLNISNLPETVLTADLEELFQDFDVLGVTVHYDETGAHLGTADLFTNPGSAKSILHEYADIAIDGQAINIGVVNENGSVLTTGIKERIRHVGRGNGGFRRRVKASSRTAFGGGRRRSASGRVTKPKGGVKSTSANLKKMSVEDLDKELEAYMGARQGKE